MKANINMEEGKAIKLPNSASPTMLQNNGK